MRTLAFALALVGLALLAGGCSDSGKRLTKPEFVRRANAICAKYEARVRSKMSGVPAGNESQLARAIEQVLPIIRKGNDELRSLKPPEDLQKRFDSWLRIADGEVDAADRLRTALRSKDRSAIQRSFAELQQKDTDQDRLARRELGLTGCASGSSSSS